AALRDLLPISRQRFGVILSVHLPKRGLALLGEDHRDRFTLFAIQDAVDVHERRMQPLRHHLAYRALARARQSDEHDVPFHDAAPRGVRARTCARSPSTLRLMSLKASPRHFSS